MRRLSVLLGLVLMLSYAANAAAQDGLTSMEQLGKELFFDKISSPSSMSCAACHAPSTGFTGPNPGINQGGAVYPGAVPQRAGNRKPPAASYATFAPIFHYDAGEGLFIGGNFWDGRATGDHLGNPAADQAQGPFLNPVEQNMPSRQAVLQVIAASKYARLWAEVWGDPIAYGTPAEIDMNYDRVGLAIAAYEASSEVNAFSSKFDMFWENAMADGMDVDDINMSNWRDYLGYGLDRNEVNGLALFNDEDKGMCSACHTLEPAGPGMPPLFTDFSFDNLGVPKNPDNPFYGEDDVYLDDGSPINPDGAAWIDPGLGGFLAGHANPAWQAMASENRGKHKVPTLRNVGKRPSEEFPKAYMHNGVFKSLREVVSFYNTRDVANWPEPEVAENVNDEELGDLGLNKKEETLIAVFMETLSDGYVDKKSDKTNGHDPGVAIDNPDVVPNPFNPTTTVTFRVAKAGGVDVAIYGVTGRRLATLATGWHMAGEYRVQVSASELASGIYFVRFAMRDQVRTTKMVLLK